METIFITGACGFIGNAILRKLAHTNHRVLAMSRNAEQDMAIQAAGAMPVRCDLETVSQQQLQQVTSIVHAAGAVGPKFSPQAFHYINATLTKRLFHLAALAGVKQFIYISSDVVVLNSNDQLEVDESAPYSTLQHAYVQSKIAAEKNLLHNGAAKAMQVICLRPRLVWGPGDKLQLPLLMQAIQSGKFRWIDKGSHRTSTTFIGNLAHAVELCLGQLQIPSGAYFVADAEQHTQVSFWQALLNTKAIQAGTKSIPRWLAMSVAVVLENLYRLLGKTPPITQFSVAVFGTDFTMSSHKAFRAFGYSPSYSFNEGLHLMQKEESCTHL